MAKENWVELEDLLGSFMAKFSYNGYRKNVEKIKNLILNLREDDYDLAVQNEYLQSERREYRQSLLRYKKLYEEAPVAYITMDLTGVIRDVNHKSVNILGLEREHLIGTSFSQFVTPNSRAFYDKHLRKLCRDSNHDKEQITITPVRRETENVLINSQVVFEGGEMVVLTVISELSD